MRLFSKDIITKIILLLILLVIIFSIKFICQQSKWSPTDEYAHMDYVDKISDGTLPKLSDSISREMYSHINNDTARGFFKNIFVQGQFAITSLSYEAIHPPFYYCILSVPNKMMEIMNVEIFMRLKILRLISYLLFVSGILMCLLIFKLLNRLGFSIPSSYAWGCVLFGLLIATSERYGLSNNMLSPLMINTTICLLLNYYINPTNMNMYLFFFSACLSIFTALSNLFIIPVLCIFFLKKYISNFSFKNLIITLLIIGVFIFLFILWKTSTKPDKAIDDNFQAILLRDIPAGKFGYKFFFIVLLQSAFTLTFIKAGFYQFAYVIILVFLISNCICLFYLKTIIKNQSWILFTGILCAAFFISTFFINKYVATINWYAFRHYLGFIPVIYVSCTAFIVVLRSKYFEKKKLI